MSEPTIDPAELRRLHERVVAGWIEIEDFDPWYAAKEALFACIPLLADRIETLEKEKERLENRLSLASERIDGLRVASWRKLANVTSRTCPCRMSVSRQTYERCRRVFTAREGRPVWRCLSGVEY